MKLTKLLNELTNERVRVELKNGTVIQGTLSNVTPAMNVTLKKASMTLKNRDPTSVEFVNVRGSTIRGIVLPDTMNLDLALQGGGRSTIAGNGNGGRKRKAEGQEGGKKRARAL